MLLLGLSIITSTTYVTMATKKLRYRWGGDWERDWGGDCASRPHSALTRSCVIYNDHE